MIRRATEADAEALTGVINRAFQVERFFLDGDRLALPEVIERLDKGCFLVEEANGQIDGCVYVELRGDRAYLGLLSVEPDRQGAGLGRRLIDAAEALARNAGCGFMDIRVVNLREELPPYYRKLGYVQTGTSPFPENVVTRLPCHFLEMSKPL